MTDGRKHAGTHGRASAGCVEEVKDGHDHNDAAQALLIDSQERNARYNIIATDAIPVRRYRSTVRKFAQFPHIESSSRYVVSQSNAMVSSIIAVVVYTAGEVRLAMEREHNLKQVMAGTLWYGTSEMWTGPHSGSIIKSLKRSNERTSCDIFYSSGNQEDSMEPTGKLRYTVPQARDMSRFEDYGND